MLAGDDYYQALTLLFADAAISIDVCMFHAAVGNPGHPTVELLRQLIAAAQRGVAIRVLLDHDRPTDPYQSTVIKAKAYLEDNGVPVRWDPANRLLHSKFVIVDRQIVVLGSHNWSAGSFFDFDDVTLAVSSTPLARALTRRVEKLWR